MKKTRLKKGFTLAEMLIAVLLLGFVSVMVSVMTSAVLSSTHTMQEVAQAEILGSEALENLEKELRFGTNFRVKDEKLYFDSANFDKGCTPFVNGEGKICMLQTGKAEEAAPLLFDGSSYGNLKVSELRVSISEENKSLVEIFLAISYGGKDLWSCEVSVQPVNGISTT